MRTVVPMMRPIELDPERGMKVTMMLADYAQVADGKLNIIGGGWDVTGPNPVPFGIAMKIEVPWRLANTRHKMRLELIDLDGVPVEVETPEGLAPLFIESEFEVGRPPGVRPGTALIMPFALNLGPTPIPPGGHYEWRLEINGETDEDWRLSFSTRPPEGGAQAEAA